MLLMHMDTVIYDTDSGTVYNLALMPKIFRATNINTDILRWIKDRAIPLSRHNADKIYSAAGLPRGGGETELIKITHGLSINDNYWVQSRQEYGNYAWKNINLYSNKLVNSISQLVFTGTGPATITGKELSPEFTGQGSYTKCILRGADGSLVLYKAGTNYEISAEIISAYICNVLGIPSVQYWFDNLSGVNVSACKIATNEALSWISAHHLTAYTEWQFHKNICDYCRETFPIEFYSMVLIDGLVLNSDRHLKNWSLQFDGYNNNLIGMAPNYDFNRAFTATHDTKSNLLFGMNVLEAAREAENMIGLDLVTKLTPIVSTLPEIWQEPFRNRILYISGIKQTQHGCYMG